MHIVNEQKRLRLSLGRWNAFRVIISINSATSDAPGDLLTFLESTTL
jgi:hypothetical protein